MVHLIVSHTGTSGLPDIYTQSPRAIGPSAEGVYVYQANHEFIWYNYYVALLCMNCGWVSAKQFKLYSLMMSLYLYFYLLHLIFGLKLEVFIATTYRLKCRSKDR